MSKIQNDQSLGLLLRSLLKENALSMRKLSSLTGIDTATISRIINGKQQANLRHLKEFAHYLNTPLEALIDPAGAASNTPENEVETGIHYSIDKIQEILKSFNIVDTNFTIERVKQELTKYEQYAQTDEGHSMILDNFQSKIEQVGSVGTFIDQLKQMYLEYCNEETSAAKRSTLGSALLYFILPTDIIPDYVFPIGYLDDAIAVQLVMNQLTE
ncbi:DUF1232 domain-containing protein [Priestia megaterium]|uniref:DUF1232 domain-containing protein n=1 Tax=Priestia megaterium TaxID=1404 RepID=UPI0004710284|nr:DUF1232 domain-containing protein [Priestia megaterium]PFA97444.1 DNA-binding protein [Priestia megaterium]